MFFKQYRNYLKDKLNKARQARGDKKYLLNLFASVDLLEDVIQKVNKDPDLIAELITLDGTRLVLKTRHEIRESIDWERP